MQSHPLHASFNVPHSGIDAMRGLGDNLRHMLRMTRGLVASGRSVDVAGLERQIGLLCAKTLDLAPDEGRMLRPMLVGLLADLDALSSALAQQFANPEPG